MLVLRPLFGLILLASFSQGFKKEGPSFYSSFPGRCPSKSRLLDRWIELPYLCVGLTDRSMDLESARKVCSEERKHSNLLNVASLRKFQIVEFPYFTKNQDSKGKYWVDAIYKGSGRWVDGTNGHRVSFEYFPKFHPEHAEEGDGLIWDVSTGELSVADRDRSYKAICYDKKTNLGRCPGFPHHECSNRGDCIHDECYCDHPFFGDSCQYKTCSPKCSPREMCNFHTGTCHCAPYLDEGCRGCQHNFTRADNSQVCFVTGPGNLTYDAARAYCRKLGMILPEVLDWKDYPNIQSMLPSGTIWLGAKRRSNTYYYQTGQQVFPYSHWVGGHGIPSTSPGDNCVKMASDLTWGNVACDAEKAYVCEVPFNSTGSSCMYANAEPCYVVINAPMLNYADAAANCKSLGGSLARIKSNAENTFVGNLMTAKAITGGLWFDLTIKNGVAIYSDSTYLPSIPPPSWAPGQPSSDSTLNCIIVDTSTSIMRSTNCAAQAANTVTLCQSPKFSAPIESENNLL